VQTAPHAVPALADCEADNDGQSEAALLKYGLSLTSIAGELASDGPLTGD
jgi:hypothetical protein